LDLTRLNILADRHQQRLRECAAAKRRLQNGALEAVTERQRRATSRGFSRPPDLVYHLELCCAEPPWMWDLYLATEDAAGGLWGRSREMLSIIEGGCAPSKSRIRLATSSCVLEASSPGTMWRISVSSIPPAPDICSAAALPLVALNGCGCDLMQRPLQVSVVHMSAACSAAEKPFGSALPWLSLSGAGSEGTELQYFAALTADMRMCLSLASLLMQPCWRVPQLSHLHHTLDWSKHTKVDDEIDDHAGLMQPQSGTKPGRQSTKAPSHRPRLTAPCWQPTGWAPPASAEVQLKQRPRFSLCHEQLLSKMRGQRICTISVSPCPWLLDALESAKMQLAAHLCHMCVADLLKRPLRRCRCAAAEGCSRQGREGIYGQGGSCSRFAVCGDSCCQGSRCGGCEGGGRTCQQAFRQGCRRSGCHQSHSHCQRQARSGRRAQGGCSHTHATSRQGGRYSCCRHSRGRSCRQACHSRQATGVC